MCAERCQHGSEGGRRKSISSTLITRRRPTYYGDATAEAVSRSLVLAQRELDRRTEAVKVMIYAHDGRPEDETPEEVKATIDRLRRTKGTVIIGLFLGDQGSLPAMQAIFGREYTVGVDDLQHLPVRLGRLLAKYRLASA